jgi:hypothetical protein
MPRPTIPKTTLSGSDESRPSPRCQVAEPIEELCPGRRHCSFSRCCDWRSAPLRTLEERPRRHTPDPFIHPRRARIPASAARRQEQPGLAAAGSGTPRSSGPPSLGGLFTRSVGPLKPPPSAPATRGASQIPSKPQDGVARAPRRRHRPDSPAQAAAMRIGGRTAFGSQRTCRGGRSADSAEPP